MFLTRVTSFSSQDNPTLCHVPAFTNEETEARQLREAGF